MSNITKKDVIKKLVEKTKNNSLIWEYSAVPLESYRCPQGIIVFLNGDIGYEAYGGIPIGNDKSLLALIETQYDSRVAPYFLNDLWNELNKNDTECS